MHILDYPDRKAKTNMYACGMRGWWVEGWRDGGVEGWRVGGGGKAQLANYERMA